MLKLSLSLSLLVSLPPPQIISHKPFSAPHPCKNKNNQKSKNKKTPTLILNLFILLLHIPFSFTWQNFCNRFLDLLPLFPQSTILWLLSQRTPPNTGNISNSFLSAESSANSSSSQILSTLTLLDTSSNLLNFWLYFPSTFLLHVPPQCWNSQDLILFLLYTLSEG